MNNRAWREEVMEAKIDAAIAYMKDADLQSLISISKICVYAEINRANLYANYPALVQKINSQIEKERSTIEGLERKGTNLINLRKENQELKRKIKAITYTCIELQIALHAANRKIEAASVKKIISKKRDRDGKF